MKKLITILAILISFFTSAQKTTPGNYTYIAQKYEWDAGVFKALGIPAGDGPAAFIPGQVPRAGALYYDSSGVDAGPKIFNGLAWVDFGSVSQSALDDTAAAIRADFPVYTASQGLYKSGNDIRLGAPIGSSAPLTDDRVIDIGYQKTLYFGRNFVPVSPNVVGYPAIYGKFIDSMKANNEASSLLPGSATVMERTIRVVGNYSSNFKVGHKRNLWYEFGDTARITANGGDFGGSLSTNLYISYLPSFTSGRASIRGGVADFEGTFSAMSNVEFPSSNASRHIRLHGWISAHHAYLRMINQPDTIDNFIFYQSLGFKEANARVLKAYNFYPNFVSADSSWSWYSKISGNRFYQEGPVTIGGGYTSSPYKFRVHGDSYFYDSVYLNTAREITDTTGTDVVLRKRSDGSLIRINPSLLGSGSGLTGSLTSTRIPFASGASTLTDDASMTWDNTNKKLSIGSGATTTGILTVNGGNQSGTASQIVVQQTGTSGLHLGTGSLGAYVRAANNKKLLLQANGTAGIEITSSATTGILYEVTNADGVHTFQTNGVTRAIINNSGLNLSEQAAPSTPATGLTAVYSKTDGLVYAKDDAGTETKLSNEITVSGTFAPTFTNVTNIASSTPTDVMYIRVGNIVTVSGLLTLTPTATGLVELRMSLPISSALTAPEQLAGPASFQTNIAGHVAGDETNDAAMFRWIATGTTSFQFRFTYTYQIL